MPCYALQLHCRTLNWHAEYWYAFRCTALSAGRLMTCDLTPLLFALALVRSAGPLRWALTRPYRGEALSCAYSKEKQTTSTHLAGVHSCENSYRRKEKKKKKKFAKLNDIR